MGSTETHASPADCTGASSVVEDTYDGYFGAWLNCTPNQQHTIQIVNQVSACINFILESTGLIAWLTTPSRNFAGPDNRVFIFAGYKGGCGNTPNGTCPIRVCKTAYGYLLQINSQIKLNNGGAGDNGQYDTIVAFYD
jgi:hypothetical protein